MRSTRAGWLAVLLGAACSDSTGPPAAASVVISPDSALVGIFDSVQLQAVAYDAAGQPLGQAIAWTSSYPLAIPVSATGMVRAYSRGSTFIVAIAGDERDTAIVRVIAPITQISAVPTSWTSFVNESLRVTVNVAAADGGAPTDTVLTWTSTDTTIATVSAQGMIRLSAPGTALVIVAAGAVADTVSISALVASLTVTPDSVLLVPGATYPLAAIALDASGDTVTGVVTWSSTNPAVAVVGAGDTITAADTGTTLLIASAGSRSDTAVARVTRVSYADVVAGEFALAHGCGIATSGEAWCWGLENYGGALGSGAGLVSSQSPLGVAGGRTFTILTSGDGFSCGLDGAGNPLCWGWGAGGRLGNPAAAFYNFEPLPVSGGHTFVALSTGYAHTCGLTTTGEAWCWGHNGRGQLGVTPSPEQTSPVAVNTALRFRAISAAKDHTCALNTDSLAYCWGDNTLGQLGDSSTTHAATPVAVYGGMKFTAVAAGSNHVCALGVGGAAYCWGEDGVGALGNGDTLGSSLIPSPVAGSLLFQELASGFQASCGIVAGGAAYCWGYNDYGQLGTNDQVNASSPRSVVGGISFARISTGYRNTCGVSVTNVAYCWGGDLNGLLGNGPAAGHQVAPAPVAGQP